MLIIVDDDEQLRRALSKVLTFEGFACITAGDGESGLVKATGRHIDVAITDLNLPGMTGAEFAWRLTQMRPGLPVIAISGELDMWDADDLADLGVRRSIPKPFGACEILAALEEVLSRLDGMAP